MRLERRGRSSTGVRSGRRLLVDPAASEEPASKIAAFGSPENPLSPVQDRVTLGSAGLLGRSLLTWLLAAALMWLWALAGSPFGGWLGGLILAALAAAALSWRLGLPSWWQLINAAVLPLAVVLLRNPASPLLWLGAALGLLLLFGPSFQSRVPLWLSGERARRALLDQLPSVEQARFLELGGGFAGPALSVQRARPDWQVDACEWAPLPFLLGLIRLRLARSTVRWWRRDFWTIDFADYDCIYAYLSPAPMAKLWAKCERELAPGSLLISYRFAVPGQTPSKIIELGGDADGLLIYRF